MTSFTAFPLPFLALSLPLLVFSLPFLLLVHCLSVPKMVHRSQLYGFWQGPVFPNASSAPRKNLSTVDCTAGFSTAFHCPFHYSSMSLPFKRPFHCLSTALPLPCHCLCHCMSLPFFYMSLSFISLSLLSINIFHCLSAPFTSSP